MGTRADFYVVKNGEYEWLGSIAWDGYPDAMPPIIRGAGTESIFREEVQRLLKRRDDATTPDMGWPWPWDTSETTDYTYAWLEDEVRASCFGHQWFNPATPEPEEDEEGVKMGVFPVMDTQRAVLAGGKRSGCMLVSAPTQKREK